MRKIDPADAIKKFGVYAYAYKCTSVIRTHILRSFFAYNDKWTEAMMKDVYPTMYSRMKEKLGVGYKLVDLNKILQRLSSGALPSEIIQGGLHQTDFERIKNVPKGYIISKFELDGDGYHWSVTYTLISYWIEKGNRIA